MQAKASFIPDAVFISYTSLNDFLNCPRAYYLKNVYRNPKTKLRMQIASPYLSLGSTVHDVIKWYLDLEQKVNQSELTKKFRNLWFKYSGKRGGFSSKEEEMNFLNRGVKMIETFVKNSTKLDKYIKPLTFPKYFLEEKLILTGNMDYIGEMEDQSLHIIDFKTGARDEDSPLQLYLYAILAETNYQKKVKKVSFWYLDREDQPKEVVLDPLDKTLQYIRQKGQQIQQALAANIWICKKEGSLCRDCQDYQDILDGKGEFMFSDFRYKKDIYYLKREVRV